VSRGEESVPESAVEELARRISDYPERSLPFFRGAFSIASTLADDVREKVLAELIESLRSGRRIFDGNQFIAATGLGERDAEQLASALSLVIGLISESSATPDEFVVAGRGRLFDAADEPVAKSIAISICDRRTEISEVVERAQLVASVLPSLAAFDIAVDLRLRFVDGTLRSSVPACVVRISTDTNSQEIWLQMSRGDLQDLIAKLTTALGDMDAAAALLPPKVS
jgi:hypothetical protein